MDARADTSGVAAPQRHKVSSEPALNSSGSQLHPVESKSIIDTHKSQLRTLNSRYRMSCALCVQNLMLTQYDSGKRKSPDHASHGSGPLEKKLRHMVNETQHVVVEGSPAPGGSAAAATEQHQDVRAAHTYVPRRAQYPHIFSCYCF